MGEQKMSEKNRFALRLNEALDEADFPPMGEGRQARLAKAVDATPRNVGKWLRGEAFPPTSRLVKIANMLNVRSNWLLSGTGEKYQASETRVPAEQIGADPTPTPSGLSKEAFEMALLWMKLPPAQRLALKKVVEELCRAE